MNRTGDRIEGDARDLLIGALLCALPLLGLRGLVRPAALGPPRPAPRCAIPVEVRGDGVGCLAPEVARAAGVRAGDRLSEGRVVARGRMLPGRLAAWDAPVELNRASPAELASLDGVGLRLAERIVRARPFAAVEELAKVRGIGRRRLAVLRPRLVIEEVPAPTRSPISDDRDGRREGSTSGQK